MATKSLVLYNAQALGEVVEKIEATPRWKQTYSGLREIVERTDLEAAYNTNPGEIGRQVAHILRAHGVVPKKQPMAGGGLRNFWPDEAAQTVLFDVLKHQAKEDPFAKIRQRI